MNISRILEVPDYPGRSVFLWGPRKTGKSSWIRQSLRDYWLVDLLLTETYMDYVSRPALLRERYQPHSWTVIDEVQKVPALLDEVHWLIENREARFLLTGSSARKLRRGQGNLLGGRAWRREMRPFCLHELKGTPYDLEAILVSGLLPPHFLSPRPLDDLRAYVADYLKEEIAAEAAIQNLPAFSDFLRVAAVTNGELLNYENVAREVGVSAKVVRSYFSILEDTLLGFRLGAHRRTQNRRLIQTDKFYLFDVGLANYLCRRRPAQGTPEFGKSFEHLVLMELLAYQSYREPDIDLHYWRTASGFEVDFLVNQGEWAIEVKSGRVHSSDLRGLTALGDEGPSRHRIVVSMDRETRQLSDRHGPVTVFPLSTFVEWLWAN